ncbi:MAG: NAD(P)/FAD-dependent oxidoreductase [Blastocatellia bacterium]|nr:NAD(P)/FAD-dependent oxidoreductase [Blastocatellia bacterium]
MGSSRPIESVAIVGAGPAGSALAIRLAGAGFGVTLIERDRFPRQKLCGEFVSPGALPHFAELGVAERIESVGGAAIHETRFYEPGGRSVTVPSAWLGSSSALSISRAQMDLALLERAVEAGVTVFDGAPLTAVSHADGFVESIKVKHEGKEVTVAADLFVDAAGRAKPLTRMVTGAAPPAEKPPYIGFKSHFRPRVSNSGRCEIFLFDGGYAGWSPIENGHANLCFMVRSEVARERGGHAGRIVDELICQNSRAAEMLDGAERVEKWLAVTVSGFGIAELTPALNVFAVGDAGAFIDPFTGSGMLMALEGAETLAGVVKGHQEVNSARQVYRSEFRNRFAGRLRTSAFLRRAAFMPRLAKLAVIAAGSSAGLSEMLARLTRRSGAPLGRL